MSLEAVSKAAETATDTLVASDSLMNKRDKARIVLQGVSSLVDLTKAARAAVVKDVYATGEKTKTDIAAAARVSFGKVNQYIS